MEKLTVTVSDACKALSLGPTTVNKLIREGRLDTVKIDKRRLVKCDSIHALIGEGGSQ